MTLVDGALSCTWSEAWRHECEARAILNLPTLDARRAYLYGRAEFKWGRMVHSGGIAQKRGPVALGQLEHTMTALWKRRVQEAKNAVLGREPSPANNDNAPKGARHGNVETA